MSRFETAYTDGELFVAIAEIAQAAKPDEPARCTQAEFDAARAGAGHPDCPTARRICTRLNDVRATSKRSWGEWLDVALNRSPESRARSAAKRGTVKQSPEQVRPAAEYALRLARHEGDHHRSSKAYTAWREERIEGITKDRRYVLPTESQIIRAYGSWSAAVTAVIQGDSVANVISASGVRRKRSKG